MRELARTGSVCPECLKVLPATIFERDGKVWMRKVCKEHGELEDLYSGSYEWYMRAARYARDGKGVDNPQITKDAPLCPKDCGLCSLHKSHTALANIVLTNRCDLTCWYCLPPDEEVLVKGLGLRPIGEVAEAAFRGADVEPAGEGESCVAKCIHVPGAVGDNARWLRVRRIYRRKYEGRILEVITSTGRRIRATEDHRFIVSKGESVVRKPAKDLVPGDVLLTLWNLPSAEVDEKPELDLVGNFKTLPHQELGKIYVRGVRPLLANGGDQASLPELRYSWKSRDSMPLSEFYKLQPEQKPGDLRLGLDATPSALRSSLPITQELMKLVGLFIADGHYTSKDLRITVGSKSEMGEILSLLECLGFPHSILHLERYGKAPQLVFGGRLVRLVFKHVLRISSSAADKRLPPISFSLPTELKLALLTGLFNGDGYVVRGERHTSLGYATVSRGLARDIVYLLAQLGIFCRIRKVPKERMKGARHDLYKIYISGHEMERLISLLNLKQSHMKKLRDLTPRRGSRAKRLGDFILDPVREVRPVEGTDYVYDLEVDSDDHSFVAGDGVLISNCFFYAKRAGYVYEPTVEQIDEMVKLLRAERPIPTNAVQLTGGEPCLRDDLLDIIKLVRSHGVDHIQLNTNGIRLAFEPELVKRVREAGVNTLYLSFDGVSEKTNPKNHWEIPLVMENARKSGLGMVLVPTVINSVNDHEVGDILKYAFKNIDIVRGVNFQPVSLVGRMPREERERHRITIPDVIKKIGEQTDGAIRMEDFFPVPTAMVISSFIESLTKRPMYDLSTHFACGAATYVFRDNGNIVPLTRFVDVEGLLEYLGEKSQELRAGKSKMMIGAKLLYNIGKFIDKNKKPRGIDIDKIIFNALIKHDYGAVGKFHMNSLFIGMMHFMDLYNYDIERVKRCCIHYAMTDKRIIPFCAFNVIPEWYRDKTQAAQGVSFEEWEKTTGRSLKAGLYKRDIKRLKSTEAYGRFIKQIEDIRAGRF